LNRFEHAFKTKKKKKKPTNRPADVSSENQPRAPKVPVHQHTPKTVNTAPIESKEGDVNPPVNRKNKRPNNRRKGNPNIKPNESES
jgi:hypothetical protein